VLNLRRFTDAVRVALTRCIAVRSSPMEEQSSVDAAAAGGAEGQMDYYDYVKKIAEGPKPSLVILNRSPEHAAVILERLFLSATDDVRLVSSQLSEDVYGTDRVKQAAKLFLNSKRSARLSILVERPVEMSASTFMTELDRAGLSGQIEMSIIPPETVSDYRFNFAVADGVNYRFEENRASRHATVQFGNKAFGEVLEGAFGQLSASAKSVAEAL